MDYSYFMALFLFACTMSFSPGPNNITLTALGMNVGFRNGIPYLLGIVSGFTCLNIAVAAGLGALFNQSQSMQMILKFAGSAYLLYLAWRVATAPVAEGELPEKGTQALPFWGGFMFQWINPKAWMMSITTFASFSLTQDLLFSSLIAIIGTFMITGLFSSSFWLFIGVQAAAYLNSVKAKRLFNYFLAAILVISVIYVLDIL